jgi:hypothetical protein
VNTQPSINTPLAKFLESQSLPELQAEIREIRGMKAALDAHERLVNLAIQWKLSQNGERQAPGVKPVLRQAILLTMGDNDPDKIWTRENLLLELKRRDWGPGGRNPENQVGNRLLEMAKTGEVEQVGRGQYRLLKWEFASQEAPDNNRALALGAEELKG